MKLIFKFNGELVHEQILESGLEYVIGSGEDCNIILPPDCGLSEKHLKVCQSNGHCSVNTLDESSSFNYQDENIDSLEFSKNTSIFINGQLELSFVVDDESTVQDEIAQENPEEALQPAMSDAPTSTKSQFSDKTTVENPGSIEYLIYIKIPNTDEKVFSVEEFPIVIGRSSDCDIPIDYSSFSRRHFVLGKKGGALTIKDLETTNGTKINSNLIPTNKEQILSPSDFIQVKDVEIHIEIKNNAILNALKNFKKSPASPNQESLSSPLGGDAGPFNSMENFDDMSEPTVYANRSDMNSTKGGSLLTQLVNIKSISISLILIALGFYFLKGNNNEKRDLAQETSEKKEQNNEALEASYQQAQNFYQTQKYDLCTAELKKLHEKTEQYESSRDLEQLCFSAAENERLQREIEAREEQARQIEEEVASIVETCKKQKIKVMSELKTCLQRGLELAPEHPGITSLISDLQVQEQLRQERLAKAKALETLRKKHLKTLAHARRLAKNKKYKKAFKSYRVFIGFKNVTGLKPSIASAKRELSSLKKEYSERLSKLEEDCKSSINQKLYKKAYPLCKKILDFEKDSQNAVSWMREAKSALSLELKSKYRESVFKESLGNLEAAKKIWNEILETDIPGNSYYNKAVLRLDRYN